MKVWLDWVQACGNRRGVDEDSSRYVGSLLRRGEGCSYTEWLLEEDMRLRVDHPAPCSRMGEISTSVCMLME